MFALDRSNSLRFTNVEYSGGSVLPLDRALFANNRRSKSVSTVTALGKVTWVSVGWLG
jgi:hypothetical protein